MSLRQRGSQCIRRGLHEISTSTRNQPKKRLAQQLRNLKNEVIRRLTASLTRTKLTSSSAATTQRFKENKQECTRTSTKQTRQRRRSTTFEISQDSHRPTLQSECRAKQEGA